MIREAFIEQIAPLVSKYAPQYGIRVASAIIAQAVLESGSGTSDKAAYHNYFGLKYRPNRCPTSTGTFTAESREQNPDGSYRKIVTEWFKFPSMEAGVQGYFDFINTANYSNVKGVTDPEEYLTLLKADQYCTSKNYVENVMKVLENNDLKRFDPEEKGETSVLPITRMITTVNRTVMTNKQNKYIVIHYTGNKTDKAKSNANYFHTVNRGASAHYFVDETSIYQVVEDKDAAWAVGKNYGSGNLFGKITNGNSISIEMCSTNGAIALATFNNTVELCKMLMEKYGISAGNVYRHYDVCSKRCPGWTGWLPTNEQYWINFKNAINGVAQSAPAAPTTSTSTTAVSSSVPFVIQSICPTNDPLSIRKQPSVSSPKVSTLDRRKYTIVEVKNGWGKLKSGKGWINISPKYVKRV